MTSTTIRPDALVFGSGKMPAKEKADDVITAVYRANLHCPQCARKIKNPLLRTQGVHSVDFDMEKNEIKVKGVIEAAKIREHIEKLTKKKVDFVVSPQPKIKDKDKEIVEADNRVKETKQQITNTTSIKVHLHCDQCEHDLRKKLLKHRGIHNVRTDIKAQTVTVLGSIDPDKLLSYMKKKVHKHAEILTPKAEKKEEKPTPQPQPQPRVKSTEIIEFKEQEKVEVKTKETNTPYFIHYVYAPQLFSDENPNACCIL